MFDGSCYVDWRNVCDYVLLDFMNIVINVDWSLEHINTYTSILTYILRKWHDTQWLFVFYLISVKAFLVQAKDDFDKKWDEPPQVTYVTALIVFSILLGFLCSE